ncbi:polyprenyl synthetase family protein [Rhodococcoides fascians A25f]|uniref:polyprenyl synthetase family protein n=1 Tax=Rhodococcoides fascians TaxID=1828 RepID=UPI0009B85024|nr:polyprenyl synthetase family protein [Rhodococcus fascians]QII04476.1 polyprenyl synthetase family protein [Rhodococcus fascians A25f]
MVADAMGLEWASPAEPDVVVISAQLRDVGAAMNRILEPHSTFRSIYDHVLSIPGKRVRAGMVLACAQLAPGAHAVPLHDAVDIAAAVEMLHESSLIHDDICDGSVLRRDNDSIAAAFGVRVAAYAGFHLAGTALREVARVLDANPSVFARIGHAVGVTYLDELSELSYGQLIETLPPDLDDDALRRHYRAVAGAKTGTLFRVACAYGGTAGGVDDDGLRSLMNYADHLALAFQIMDDVRDIEGGPNLGKDACGDLERRVPTWPVIEWLCTDAEARTMWLDESVSSRDLQAALTHSGAIASAREFADSATRQACVATECFVDSPAREHLRTLARRVVLR